MSGKLDFQALIIQQLISGVDNDMWSFSKLKKLLAGFVYVVVWTLTVILGDTLRMPALG